MRWQLYVGQVFEIMKGIKMEQTRKWEHFQSIAGKISK